MVIGVDNGNANTKTVHTAFTSGITEHDVKPPIANEILRWENKYYTPSGKRESFKRDKTTDNKCFVKTLFAIAKEVLACNKYTPEMDIDLAVGLPPGHYGKLKDKFADYFKKFGNPIHFEYNEKPFTLNIKSVMVFVQAYSAITNKASELKNYSMTYVIDIGGYTTDVLLLREGRPDMSCCCSLENGVITMYGDIKEKISTSYEIAIEEDHILDVLLDRPTILSEEVKEDIREMARNHANNLLDELREKGIDLKANPAILLGGGALLLKTYIQSSPMVASANSLEFIEDISSNALGYTMLANAMLSMNNRKAG